MKAARLASVAQRQLAVRPPSQWVQPALEQQPLAQGLTAASARHPTQAASLQKCLEKTKKTFYLTATGLTKNQPWGTSEIHSGIFSTSVRLALL